MYGTCITDIIYSYFDVSEMRLSQYVLYCKFTKGLLKVSYKCTSK